MKKITDFQRYVTKENGTEPPYDNLYNNHFEEGIYVDIYTDEVLFSSLDKFDSHCGWPSFSKSVEPLEYVDDYTHGMTRTEVRSTSSDSHLGHVFDDGPNGSLRYCINSASIRFVAKKDMEQEGFASYLTLFEKEK